MVYVFFFIRRVTIFDHNDSYDTNERRGQQLAFQIK